MAQTEADGFPTNLAKSLTNTMSLFKRELASCWIFLSFSDGKAQCRETELTYT